MTSVFWYLILCSDFFVTTRCGFVHMNKIHHRGKSESRLSPYPTSCIPVLAWWEKSLSPALGNPRGQTRLVRQEIHPSPRCTWSIPPEPLPTPHPSPLQSRASPDVSLTGWIRAQKRVHSVVTSTRCAPLTQNTQPVDIPYRHHTDPPHNQRHTCFYSHSSLGAPHTAVIAYHMSVFSFPLPLFIFSYCQTYLQNVNYWG